MGKENGKWIACFYILAGSKAAGVGREEMATFPTDKREGPPTIESTSTHATSTQHARDGTEFSTLLGTLPADQYKLMFAEGRSLALSILLSLMKMNLSRLACFTMSPLHTLREISLLPSLAEREGPHH